MRLSELIRFLPESTKKDVSNAFKKYSNIIEKIIQNDTGLKFSRVVHANNSIGSLLKNGENEEGLQKKNKVQCKVLTELNTALPTFLEKKEIESGDEIAALLNTIKGRLNQLDKSGKSVRDFFNGHKENKDLKELQKDGVFQMESEVKRLIQIADSFKIIKFIFQHINEDILGIYKYPTSDDDPDLIDNTTATIKIYWGVIGLISANMNLDLAALTAVVTAHEYAHAYTHLGFDIDGNRWSNRGFANAEPLLKESLAQFYTFQIVQQLKKRILGIEYAFYALLKEQSPIYKKFTTWIDDYHAGQEQIRSVLIRLRLKGALNFEEFTHELKEECRRFRQY
jgi:hypothetical protein